MDMLYAGAVYIPMRMEELGYKKNYLIRNRVITLTAGQTQIVEAFNQYYILIEADEDLFIKSRMGVFDASKPNTDDQLEEHQGIIQIINYGTDNRQVNFIQVIPKNK